MMTATQVDLFLNQIINAPIKDAQRLMEFPFFSLQKQPRHEPFVYDDGTVRIEITPGSKGIATIYDKDLLIYLASIINERLERGFPVYRTIYFPAYDFLSLTGRGTGKRGYELFYDTLHRLRSTNIVTTIETGGNRERRGFGWIESWRVVEKENKRGKKVMVGVEVTLNQWMFRAITTDRAVLTINRAYFSLTGGLERRLYELARKHVGSQAEWWISLTRLYEKCGSTDTLKKFKFRIKQLAANGRIPDYELRLVDGDVSCIPLQVRDKTTMVWFAPKADTKGAEQTELDTKAVPNVPIPLTQNEIPAPTDDGYKRARDICPGYDIQHLVHEFQRWVVAKEIKVRNLDFAFLSFCKAYKTNHPL